MGMRWLATAFRRAAPTHSAIPPAGGRPHAPPTHRTASIPRASCATLRGTFGLLFRPRKPAKPVQVRATLMTCSRVSKFIFMLIVLFACVDSSRCARSRAAGCGGGVGAAADPVQRNTEGCECAAGGGSGERDIRDLFGAGRRRGDLERDAKRARGCEWPLHGGAGLGNQRRIPGRNFSAQANRDGWAWRSRASRKCRARCSPACRMR